MMVRNKNTEKTKLKESSPTTYFTAIVSNLIKFKVVYVTFKTRRFFVYGPTRSYTCSLWTLPISPPPSLSAVWVYVGVWTSPLPLFPSNLSFPGSEISSKFFRNRSGDPTGARVRG